MIAQNVEQRIKDAAQVFDVVSRFIDLKKSGSRYLARCPFHDEKTPSFYVTPSLNIYKCYGCGAGGDAIKFLEQYRKMTYPEALEFCANLYSIPLEHGSNAAPRMPVTIPQAAPQPAPPSFIPKDIFKASLTDYHRNNFSAFLIDRYGKEAAAAMIGRYFVGTSKKWPGANVFWQIDTTGKVRAGKIMLYNPATGKRRRETLPTWVHSVLKIEPYNLAQCWFGEHLLPKRPAAAVGIVESEKTAILASLYFPNLVWIAAGCKDGLSESKWTALKGRNVVMFPDAGTPDKTTGKTPFNKWSDSAQEMQKAGIAANVSDLIERKATAEERAQGWDLADYLLKYEPAEFAPQAAPQAAQPHDGHAWHDYTTKEGERFSLAMSAEGYPALWDDPRPPMEAAAELMRANGWGPGTIEPATPDDLAAWERMMDSGLKYSTNPEFLKH